MVPMANMEDLPECFGAVSCVFELLGQSDGLGGGFPEIGGQIVDAQTLWPSTSKQCVARGRAYCLIAVGSIKPHATRGQFVDVR